jgi:hypothetical protein
MSGAPERDSDFLLLYHVSHTSANHPLGDQQIRDPAQPGDRNVTRPERPMEHAQRQRQVKPEGNSGERQAEVSHHPEAVRFDIPFLDHAISLDGGEEPQYPPEFRSRNEWAYLLKKPWPSISLRASREPPPVNRKRPSQRWRFSARSRSHRENCQGPARRAPMPPAMCSRKGTM